MNIVAPFLNTSKGVSLRPGYQRQAIRHLNRLIAQFPGRALFATRFTLEDQVLTHLIFSNNLPVRVFARPDFDQYQTLVRTIDHFGQTIEVTFSQAELAAREHLSRHPELAQEYDKHPGAAPLGYIFQTGYLFITGLRAHEAAAAFLPGSAGQRTVFHPLFDWSEKHLLDYVRQHELPLDLLPAADARRIQTATASVRRPGKWWLVGGHLFNFAGKINRRAAAL